MSNEIENKTKKLLQIKGQVEEAKSKADRLRGTLDNLDSQLKQHGCDNVEDARKKLSKIDMELAKSEQNLMEGIGKLEQEYQWN